MPELLLRNIQKSTPHVSLRIRKALRVEALGQRFVWWYKNGNDDIAMHHVNHHA